MQQQRELRLLDMVLAYGPHEAFARLRAVFYLYAHARAAAKPVHLVRKPRWIWIGQIPECPGQVVLCFDPNTASEFIFQMNPAGGLVAGAQFTQHALAIIAAQEDQVGAAVAERAGRRLDS